MQRNNREFITPGGRNIVLKEYLTYGEIEVALKIEDKVEQTKKLMELVLVSVDGVTENVANVARELPVAEYTSIAGELKAILEGNFPKVK